MSQELKMFPTDKLLIVKIGLDSYLKGCIDTFKIFEDIYIKTKILYEDKIKEIDDEIASREI